MSDLTDKEIKESRRLLWRKGILHWKLDSTQKEIYNLIKHAPKTTVVVNCARRLGKCMEENTDVLTPNGPVAIKDIKVGDQVYGFNKDGSTNLTTVIAHEYMGEKEVVELTKNGRVLAECTKDHRWAVNNPVSRFKIKEKNITQFTRCDKIHRRLIDVPCGNVHNPHAYSIGLILGDGCSRQGVKQIHISSAYEEPIKAVANELNCQYWRQSNQNYTWALSINPNGKGKKNNYPGSVFCKHYDDWCKNRYAHEKIADIEEINSWDRSSLLAFLAGLIDSDGSVGVIGNILTIQFAGQSRSMVDAFSFAFYKLFQYKPAIIRDKRTKYKNGPVYQICIRNNLFNKKALKELDRFLHVPTKKWKSEYSRLVARAENSEYCGVIVGKSRIARTYDIQVDNETNLYVLANGLVTHNSYILSILALEQCLQSPKSIVTFLQPEQKMIRLNIKPLMDKIFEDSPREMRPKFITQDSVYKFYNGSEIRLAGTDNGNHEKLRGGDAHLAIIDEAAFCKSDLDYIIKSILIPTTTLTGGKVVLSSSSPKSTDHDYFKYMQQAVLQDCFIKKTIDDAMLDPSNERITRYIAAEIEAQYINGRENSDFRREYLCETAVDSESVIIPEFTEDIEKDICVEWVRPPFCDRYVGMDIGFRDLTVCLFGYYDFLNAVTVIEREFVINGPKMTTPTLAEAVKSIERDLWTDSVTGEETAPYKRVADNNLILLNDLYRQHGLLFFPTKKDNKEAAINDVRMSIASRQIIINPACKTLISHLKYGVWNKNRTEFARNGEGSHYDAIDALIYFIRNVDKSRNPFPRDYKYQHLKGKSGNDLFLRASMTGNDPNELSKDSIAMSKAFGSAFSGKRSIKRQS